MWQLPEWSWEDGISAADVHKMNYAVEAASGSEDPFSARVQLDPAILEVMPVLVLLKAPCAALHQAIEWQASLSPADVRKKREEMLSQIELAAEALRESGKSAEWFHGCDDITKAVSKTVNGFLFQELLAASGHADAKVADLFRTGPSYMQERATAKLCQSVTSPSGAKMVGELDCSGVGTPMPVDLVKNVAELKASCQTHNTELLPQLREDSNASELLRLASEDAKLGRMSFPKPAQADEMSEILLNPRFGVEQLKEDGSVKVRAVDHLSWSPSSQLENGRGEPPSKKAGCALVCGSLLLIACCPAGAQRV